MMVHSTQAKHSSEPSWRKVVVQQQIQTAAGVAASTLGQAHVRIFHTPAAEQTVVGLPTHPQVHQL
jgi:hypothetical protein